DRWETRWWKWRRMDDLLVMRRMPEWKVSEGLIRMRGHCCISSVSREGRRWYNIMLLWIEETAIIGREKAGLRSLATLSDWAIGLLASELFEMKVSFSLSKG